MNLTNGGERSQLVVFRVGTDEFGIPIHLVREIIKESKVVRIPNIPSYITGVLNLRGLVIPIVDLAELLGLESQDNAQTNRKILIVDRNNHQVGYLVNEVSEVLSVPEGALEQTTSSLGGMNNTMVEYVCKLEDRLFPVLNMDSLLGYEDLEELDGLERPVPVG